MKAISLVTTTLFMAAWIAAFYWWCQPVPMAFPQRVPDPANKAVVAVYTVDLEGTFQSFAAPRPTPLKTSIPGSWPWFRGLNHDAIAADSVELADTWPQDGPPVVWELPLGSGYAGAAVHGGRFYVLDYDEAEQSDSLRCFAMDDASELWRRSYRIPVKRNHGMSRTVVATDGRYVVGLGPKCHVICCDAITGAFKWGMDLVRDYGTTVPEWYAGQCPFIVDGKVILAPAGSAVLMMAVDCESGEVAWSVPNTPGWKMSHASIVPMTIGGVRTYVYFAEGGAIGVSPDGKTLWQTTLWNKRVVAPSPVQTGPDRMIMTSGYGAGSMELIVRDGAVSKGRAWTKKQFACEQQTPIVYDGCVYSVMPNDAGANRQRLACMTVDGTIKWYSDANKFGLGPYMIADDRMFLLSDDGVLTMATVNASGFRKLAEADVLDGKDAWGPMAFVNGRMIVRDMKTMKCLDLRKRR